MPLEEVTNGTSDVTQFKIRRDQTIETIAGKETLSEIAAWHKYISIALSNNPVSFSATKVIQIIGNLVNRLEPW